MVLKKLMPSTNNFTQFHFLNAFHPEDDTAQLASNKICLAALASSKGGKLEGEYVKC